MPTIFFQKRVGRRNALHHEVLPQIGIPKAEEVLAQNNGVRQHIVIGRPSRPGDL
jgi:hypothetical protein